MDKKIVEKKTKTNGFVDAQGNERGNGKKAMGTRSPLAADGGCGALQKAGVWAPADKVVLQM